MSDTITAKEAAAILGVSLPTLYAYVSRGLLASSADGGNRARTYAREEVLRLAARKADGKRAGHAVQAAMSWGVPVLESRISLIADGKLYYRGRDACELAATATLEQTAAILWDDGQGSPHAGCGECGTELATLPAALRAATAALRPVERAMALLPVLAGARRDIHSPARLLRMLAAALLNADIDEAPLHAQLARAWQAGEAGTEALRVAMVVLADHELNNSAFTVRCVASTGAALPAVLCAGLAALSGREHGGHYLIARKTIEAELAAPGSVRPPAMEPGFGHPLYPDGDPRAVRILGMLRTVPGSEPILALADRAAGVGTGWENSAHVDSAHVNSDYALAALELALGLPPQAGMTLFALSRCAGWLAHAAEQARDGRMIRPRARYIGKPAGSGA
ncbi:citrate synthase family protein [Pseudoduganella namucuonensis]|uniref:citrate synthase (unknown stereospecificity) n=1 Tax=Pseudoduganella namucuonensis TaxID=1035707 RepID=A0A1I7JRB6_9BURK|nr:citrate synthase family protein [Pseudoduganella namucuonensis]SFU87712.1 citrate synthase [Pseudoduganella namucuonensis]